MKFISRGLPGQCVLQAVDLDRGPGTAAALGFLMDNHPQHRQTLSVCIQCLLFIETLWRQALKVLKLLAKQTEVLRMHQKRFFLDAPSSDFVTMATYRICRLYTIVCRIGALNASIIFALPHILYLLWCTCDVLPSPLMTFHKI